MARYIDADALMKEIKKCEFEITGRGIMYHAGSVQSIIRTIPTAGVVPTREIFNTIDSLKKVNCIKSHGIEVNWDNSSFCLIATSDIAELKKKYAEGKPE
jgi:hypothetical protein